VNSQQLADLRRQVDDIETLIADAQKASGSEAETAALDLQAAIDELRATLKQHYLDALRAEG